jgi:hypothetical protein
VEPVDRQVRALDQPVLLAQLERAQEQPLEQRRVDETASMSVRKRLVHRQPLDEAEAEEAAQVQPHPRLPQQLPHRADPFERTHDHQLHQHDRVDRRPTDVGGVVRRGNLPHEPPVDQPVEPAITVVLSNQLVQADHLHLQRRRLPLQLPHRHPAPPTLDRRTSRG